MARGAPDWVRKIEVTINLGQPTSERAIDGFGSVTTSSSSYQTIKSWTVATGYVGVLVGVEMICDNFSIAQWKLEVDSVAVLEDDILQGEFTIPFPELKLAAGSVVTLSVKSDGSTEIMADGNIDAKEVLQ